MEYLFKHDYPFFDGRAKWVWSQEGLTRGTPDPRPVQCRYFARRLTCKSPQKVILALSADTRYMLYVNGRIVARGPQKGDVAHQFYDVLDLTAEMREGENVLLVRVDSYAKSFPYFYETGPSASEMSAATIFVADGFVLGEDGSVVEYLATDPATDQASGWRVKIDPALEFVHPEEMGSYVGFKESIDLTRLPKDFYANPDFADGSWAPVTLAHTAYTPLNDEDAFLPHRLIPRSIEPLEMAERGFWSIRDIRAGEARPELDDDGMFSLTVAPHQTSTCILDAGRLATAYPQLVMEGGQGARIRLKYAECLTREGKKDDRNAVKGYDMIGYCDLITAGNGHEVWSPLHWRTFRYVEVTVETAEEPLTISSLRFTDCHYPIFPYEDFRSSDEQLNSFWEIGIRTQQACAHETYEDCPYYEQLQYGGDTQAQMLFTYAVSGNTILPRQTIRFMDWSRLPEGLTQSRYPCRPTQIIPYWSLHYLLMLSDWYWYTGEVASIREEILNAESVIRWFLRRKDESGLVGALQHWCVADWSPEWVRDFNGIVPGAKEGPTAFTNFFLIAVLERMAELLGLLEEKATADKYRKEAKTLRKLAHAAFWSKKEKAYVDSLKYPVVSQLTNAWALLIGLPSGAKAQQALAGRLHTKKDICRAAYFGQFYLFEAWGKLNRPDLIVEHFATYRELAAKGITTWPEDIVGGRSECHAWSNAATYHLLRTVLGFEVAEPGCRRLTVSPYLEGLTEASGCFVTPKGPVQMSYDEGAPNEFWMNIPEGVSVTFSYKDIQRTLEAGEHIF